MYEINQKLEHIRALALTAKTAIYNEDAMTAIELAGVTACKVNQCVDVINEIIDIVENITVDVTAISVITGYNNEREELNIL